MSKQAVLEGTWQEISEHAREFDGEQRFRLVPLPAQPDTGRKTPGTGQMLRKGMFPQLRGLTEEDFKGAEWRGEDIDITASGLVSIVW